MEADWEFEVGGDAPVIDAHWEGFVDLQLHPELAAQLPEAAQFPALAEALARLNAAESLVRSSKCDLWPHLEAEEFDPDELDAPPSCAAHAMGCYVDLLPRSEQTWLLPAEAEKACNRLCGLLRAVPLLCCRADLVIRRAYINPELIGFGVTAYLTACGQSPEEAASAFQAALHAFTDALASSQR